MGYQSTVQVIQRGGKNRQWYLICPAPLAQALEIEKGEVIEVGGGGQAHAGVEAHSPTDRGISRAEAGA